MYSTIIVFKYEQIAEQVISESSRLEFGGNRRSGHIFEADIGILIYPRKFISLIFRNCLIRGFSGI